MSKNTSITNTSAMYVVAQKSPVKKKKYYQYYNSKN